MKKKNPETNVQWAKRLLHREGEKKGAVESRQRHFLLFYFPRRRAVCICVADDESRVRRARTWAVKRAMTKPECAPFDVT